ncbi:putative arca-like protein [Diplogelasinospora grovesii]|uniref:Arca-like protein n=1 Tax=Diplogelasinospora grovesii TaxID=303347 RepID=A0AAN6MUM2_9PEZI|nr:putative arca-like protein [Diplogelasinospora grovesii]
MPGAPTWVPGREYGGIPPRKILPTETVVEAAPSHDGAPCFTAYTVDEENKTRPLFALRIYDTRPNAGDVDETRDLAIKIHEGTEFERCDRAPTYDRDRIEVVGLPMPSADVTSDEQRIEICKAHHMAEVAARNKLGSADFYIPATFEVDGWWRGLVIIDRLEDGWESAALNRPKPENGFLSERPPKVPESERFTNPFGGFMYFRWELTDMARREYEHDPLPETAITHYPIYKLAASLASLRDGMSAFRCFVLEGGLDKELRLASH